MPGPQLIFHVWVWPVPFFSLLTTWGMSRATETETKMISMISLLCINLSFLCKIFALQTFASISPRKRINRYVLKFDRRWIAWPRLVFAVLEKSRVALDLDEDTTYLAINSLSVCWNQDRGRRNNINGSFAYVALSGVFAVLVGDT